MAATTTKAKKNSKAAKKTLRTVVMRTTQAEHARRNAEARKVNPRGASTGGTPAPQRPVSAGPKKSGPKTGGKGKAAKMRDQHGDVAISLDPLPEWQTAEGAEVMDIRVDLIVEAPGVVNGGRGPETPAERKEIEGLSASIAQVGLMESVGVYVPNGKVKGFGMDTEYVLVWGSRRWRAHKLLGRTMIEAKVYPSEAAAIAATMRLTENVQRAGMNIAQECASVAALADDLRAELNGQDRDTEWFCEQIGGKLGKSLAWVRDRIYVARLGGKARELIAAGRLPLGHAREVTLLADPALQEEAAVLSAAAEDGTGLLPLKKLQAYVRKFRFSLKTVPWITAVSFAGKGPCEGCDDNTRTDAMLYAHDAEAMDEVRKENEKGGLCRNRACFEHKRKAAEEATKRGLGKVEKAFDAGSLGEGKITPTELNFHRLVPVGLDAVSFAKVAKKAISDGSPDLTPATAPAAELPDGGPRKAEIKPKGPTAEQLAEVRFAACYAHYRDETMARAIKALSESPGSLTQFAVMVVTGTGKKLLVPGFSAPSAYPEEDDRIAKVCQSPKTRELLKGLELTGAEKLAAMAEVEKQVGEFWKARFEHLAPAALALAAEMVGAKGMPVRPVYEEILAEAKKEVAGGAQS